MKRSRPELWPVATFFSIAALLGLVALWGSRLIGYHGGEVQQALTPQQLKDWFTYEFAEIKGVAQQFVTVVVGVLVFSITFSEKIVRYDAAHASQRFFLKASWCCCILAIIGGGITIVLVMMAGAFVRYPSSGNYQAPQAYSFLSLGLSGLVFVLGLAALLASTFAKPPTLSSAKKSIVDQDDGTG